MLTPPCKELERDDYVRLGTSYCSLRELRRADTVLCPSARRVSTSSLPDGPARHTADTVLFAGDRVFDIVAATSFSSSWFEKDPKKPN